MTLILDAGALIAVDRGDYAMRSLFRLEMAQRRTPVTSSAVVAQVWRGDPRQAILSRVLSGVRVQALTPELGRRLGVLLGRSGTADVVDAHVAWLAAPGDIVLTSDPIDLARLLDARRVAAVVRKI